MILFVDPHKESLIVIVEKSSFIWPVSIQASSILESVIFFETVTVSDKLFLLPSFHFTKLCVSTSELSLELAASLNNFLLNLFSLLSRDSWTKRIACQVTCDSYSCRIDHLCICCREW